MREAGAKSTSAQQAHKPNRGSLVRAESLGAAAARVHVHVHACVQALFSFSTGTRVARRCAASSGAVDLTRIGSSHEHAHQRAPSPPIHPHFLWGRGGREQKEGALSQKGYRELRGLEGSSRACRTGKVPHSVGGPRLKSFVLCQERRLVLF